MEVLAKNGLSQASNEPIKITVYPAMSHPIYDLAAKPHASRWHCVTAAGDCCLSLAGCLLRLCIHLAEDSLLLPFAAKVRGVRTW